MERLTVSDKLCYAMGEDLPPTSVFTRCWFSLLPMLLMSMV